MKTTITNGTNVVKKTLRVIILLLVITGITKTIGIYQGYMDNKNFVEPYCAAKYQHNVDEYKACKVLSPTKVLQNLKDNTANACELESIPLIDIKY